VLERLIEDISFEAPDKVAAAGDTPLDDEDEQVPGEPADMPEFDLQKLLAKAKEQVEREAREGMSRETLDFYAADEVYYVEHVVDKQQVREKLQGLLKQDDLSKYIL
jgi:hypothetical protein